MICYNYMYIVPQIKLFLSINEEMFIESHLTAVCDNSISCGAEIPVLARMMVATPCYDLFSCALINHE